MPTREGYVFAAMLVAMWLAAVNYSNNLAFALTFLLAGLFMAAMTHAFRNLVGLRVHTAGATDAFAGGEAGFHLRLANPGGRPRYALEVRAANADGAVAVDVPSGDGADLTLSLPAHRRGPLSLGRLTVSTRHPTGLFRAWSRVRPVQECLVYPAPEPASAAPPPTLGGSARGGRQVRGDEDFAGLRQYRPGDPIRRIAWKAGRSDELQVKQFEGEGAARLWLDWDATSGLPLERRLSRLCRWVLDAHRQGRVYGLRLPETTLKPSAGERHFRRCLRALARHP